MTTPADDILEGVDEIAAFLKWKPRRVYAVREGAEAGCPIRKRKGVGLYAFKSELTAWLRDPSTLPGSSAAA